MHWEEESAGQQVRERSVLQGEVNLAIASSKGVGSEDDEQRAADVAAPGDGVA